MDIWRVEFCHSVRNALRARIVMGYKQAIYAYVEERNKKKWVVLALM